MALLFDCIYQDILALILAVSICIYTYFKWSYQYWKRREFPYLEPSFPFGNMPNPIINPKSFTDLTNEWYAASKAKGYTHVGLFSFHQPMYMPISLEHIRNVMSKDFDHFMDRGVYYNEKDDPLSAHLFAIEGVKWRNLRMKLTPTFTSGKMKMMFPTLIECGKQMENYMKDISLKDEPVNIKDILGCFTTDVIASCAFGIECDSFKDTNSEFRTKLKRSLTMTNLEFLQIMVGFIFPNFARSMGFRFIPAESSDFFLRIIRETVEYREKNSFLRKDFMQLLLDLKNNVLEKGQEYQHDGKSLTMNELAAQAFIFLAAGFETSSTTMTFCLYELATNQDIQDKIREEVITVLDRYDGNLTYEATMEMTYMTQAIEETLRKYPPVPSLNRICTADYKIPNTDIVIEKGTLLTIPVTGLQHDEDHFPDPEKFDPERFNKENKPKIPHFSYLPFGEGPRVCIGVRFGMMQVKVGLALLLKDYIFTLNDKTITPLKTSPSNFILSTLGDIWLNVNRIK